MKYYVIAIQQSYGMDAYIIGSKDIFPRYGPFDGEVILGPYNTYTEASEKARKIENANTPTC